MKEGRWGCEVVHIIILLPGQLSCLTEMGGSFITGVLQHRQRTWDLEDIGGHKGQSVNVSRRITVSALQSRQSGGSLRPMSACSMYRQVCTCWCLESINYYLLRWWDQGERARLAGCRKLWFVREKDPERFLCVNTSNKVIGNAI